MFSPARRLPSRQFPDLGFQSFRGAGVDCHPVFVQEEHARDRGDAVPGSDLVIAPLAIEVLRRAPRIRPPWKNLP
jgi:hypothetical protein